MPDLPMITSWGQAGLLLIGAGLAIKFVLPLLKNGTGKDPEAAEWRGRVQQILESNSDVVQRLMENQESVSRVVMEIERRTRDSEHAFRLIGELHAQAGHRAPV